MNDPALPQKKKEKKEKKKPKYLMNGGKITFFGTETETSWIVK